MDPQGGQIRSQASIALGRLIDEGWNSMIFLLFNDLLGLFNELHGRGDQGLV